MSNELGELGRVVTAASTKNGVEQWVADITPYPSHSSIVGENTLCSQSYAHNRISRLMELRDSANLLGDDILLHLARLPKPCEKNETVVQCIEREASAIAIKSNLVARGLTGMVTEDDMKCLSLEVDEEGKAGVCRYGIGRDFDYFDEDYVQESGEMYGPPQPWHPDDEDGGRWYGATSGIKLHRSLIGFSCALMILLLLQLAT